MADMTTEVIWVVSPEQNNKEATGRKQDKEKASEIKESDDNDSDNKEEKADGKAMGKKECNTKGDLMHNEGKRRATHW